MPDVSQVSRAWLDLGAVEALAAHAKTFPSRASENGPGLRAALESAQRTYSRSAGSNREGAIGSLRVTRAHADFVRLSGELLLIALGEFSDVRTGEVEHVFPALKIHDA
jgi:hypothetical protein